jgi:hypothetical protein
MITYSTNWMGPINAQWIKEHGDCWAAGRIDIYGEGFYNSLELGLPAMHKEDWARFSDWLDKFESETVMDLAAIVTEYEKTNPPIRWCKEMNHDS